MAAEVARIFALYPCDPIDVSKYEQTLYPNGEVLRAPCTAKSTVYCAYCLSALLCAKVKKHLAGDLYEKSLTMDFQQVSTPVEK